VNREWKRLSLFHIHFYFKGKMFLTLNHQKLDIYAVSRSVVLECYQMTKNFPAEERYNLISQIRRAALSVHLNIAEGCARKSEGERKRFYEVSRSSLIEVDAALDISGDLYRFQLSRKALP
jgi:four helix bundle protein